MDILINAVKRIVADMIGQIAQPRYGIVTSVDPHTHSVRVTLQPEGVQTGWIPDTSAFATGGGYGVVSPLSAGDQVKVDFMHGDADHPVIAGRVFSTVDMPPVSPATGQPVKPGEFGVFTNGAWLHLSGGTIYGAAAKIVFKGDLEVDGKITSTGDMVAGTVSQQHHEHTEVKTGGDLSGPPA